MRFFAPLVLLALTGVPLHAETVTDFTLENGMQVVVIEDHRAPAVVHMVWYKVGSADEPPGKSGIAHFLEHLMFKGTDTVEPGAFSATVEANGGNDNAFTSWDYTAYFQRLAADRLELVMQMEADRMRNLVLSEDHVTTERQVILEERSQRVDSDPAALFSEQRAAAQYMNHRYGIPIIGWRQEMEGLTRQDALGFYETFYAPNNAVLIVAGDVDPAEVRRLADIYYAPLKPTIGLAERLRPQEPPQLAERRISLADARVAQPYVMRTYLAPERDSGAQQKAAALTVLAEVLGGNPATSVLGTELQFETQKAIYTAAFYDGSSLDDTTFGLVIVPAEGVTLQDAEDAMDAVVARFLTEGIDPAQFARIKSQIRAATIYAKDDVQGLARDYGAGLTSGLSVADIQGWPAVLDAVTPQDVLTVAAEVLNRKTAVTGWLTATPTKEATQ